MPYSVPISVPITPPQRRTRLPGGPSPDAYASRSTLRLPHAPSKTVFHFREGDEIDNSLGDVPTPPLLELNPNNSEALHLSLDIPHSAVPFPCSLPLSPPLSPHNYRPCPRTSASRTCSSPVVLSNGKPLKSSLKLSSASDSDSPSHLRARSAPSTPHPTFKNVHFAEERDRLESVCVFSRSEKPASLSIPREDAETEAGNQYFSDSFPFPRIPSIGILSTSTTFYLDHTTSAIPSSFRSPYANIHLESLALSASSESTPVLVGSLIVRNIAYEKHVAVRFTMDDWQTTSEVLARHVVSLPFAPLAKASCTVGRTGKDLDNVWDQFTFTIRLEDYVFKLQEKVMWLVARYTTAGGEWWDNNDGRNYRIGFKVGVVEKGTVTAAPVPTLRVASPRKNPCLVIPPQPSTSIKIPTPPTSTSSSQIATHYGKLGPHVGEESGSGWTSSSESSPPSHLSDSDFVSAPFATTISHFSSGASSGCNQRYPAVSFPVRPSLLPRALHPRPSPPPLPPPPASLWTTRVLANGSHTSFLASSPPLMKKISQLNPSDNPPVDNWSGLSCGGERDKKQDVADLDSVYEAFVKQWCFEEGPPPGASTSVGLVVEC